MIGRRAFLFGAAAVTAPAIIRLGILMPVKRILLPEDDGIGLYSMAHPHRGLMHVAEDVTEHALMDLPIEIKRPYGGPGLYLRR